MATNWLLGVPLNAHGFYSFVFGATLVQYNLHYVSKTEAVSGSLRLAWSKRNRQIHFILLAAGIALIIYSLFSFQLRHFFILLLLGVIASVYSFPVLPFGKKKRLKEYGLLKIITLSLLWTLVTVWFPVNNYPYDKLLFAFIFIERFIFMFVLCLLFDVRDHELDAAKHIRTLPVMLGKKASYQLAYILVILFFVICVVHQYYQPFPGFLVAMVLSAAATAATIFATQKFNSDIIFLAGIDGMMLLQAVMIWLFSLKF